MADSSKPGEPVKAAGAGGNEKGESWASPKPIQKSPQWLMNVMRFLAYVVVKLFFKHVEEFNLEEVPAEGPSFSSLTLSFAQLSVCVCLSLSLSVLAAYSFWLVGWLAG
jgi:hypothetical protein